MAIKPILFNTEMVRAILDGRKTCTRRVAKNVPDHIHRIEPVYENGRFQFDCFYSSYVVALDAYADFCMPCLPPYQQGDILYVRETWSHPIVPSDKNRYVYRADEVAEDGFKNEAHIWHPSIHMPKEAARIWMKVTDVRVERLQEMTDDDAEAEGCFDYTSTALGFPDVWDSTIKKSNLDRYSWQANPWVWVIEFERCEKPREGWNRSTKYES